MGSVYLLCLDRPLAHARHYVGYSADSNPLFRVEQHRAGRSRVTFMRAVVRAGITFTLTRVWYGAGRTFERKIKNGHFLNKTHPSRSAICPRCGGESAFGIAIYPQRRDNRRRDGRARRAVGAVGTGGDRANLPVHLAGWDDRWPVAPDSASRVERTASSVSVYD